ncbi:MAG TPA: PA0069 family radical SAM protein [Gammaproteobacteria bacterium]|nr:PA0069 family radical SAM protein [Gammaproteobacteria bacterium]
MTHRLPPSADISRSARVNRTGRGALSNPEGRFETRAAERIDDGWGSLDEALPPLATTVMPEMARSIISRNQSPDIPFEQSINPYRGCEHGCLYCYARPSHAYLNLSPGLDFETKLFFKPNAAAQLEAELSRPDYRCRPITLGANTDPYQPIEKRLHVTRDILEVLRCFHHPVTIITKSALIERDVELLAEMAREGLAKTLFSVTTLDNRLKRTLEPRTASPAARLAALAAMSGAGIPAGVMVAPIIPGVNDSEIEAILERAAAAGAISANYTLLRLPYELKALFEEWLWTHMPLRADHVLNLIRDIRGGRLNESGFGKRMRGGGRYAELIAQRFRLACRRHGLDRRSPALDSTQFRVPTAQMDLLD